MCRRVQRLLQLPLPHVSIYTQAFRRRWRSVVHVGKHRSERYCTTAGEIPTSRSHSLPKCCLPVTRGDTMRAIGTSTACQIHDFVVHHALSRSCKCEVFQATRKCCDQCAEPGQKAGVSAHSDHRDCNRVEGWLQGGRRLGRELPCLFPDDVRQAAEAGHEHFQQCLASKPLPRMLRQLWDRSRVTEHHLKMGQN